MFVDLGCNGIDVAHALAVRADGSVILGGITNCVDFPNDAAAVRLVEDGGSSIHDRPLGSGPVIYPNPAVTTATIEIGSDVEREIIIAVYDARGRLLFGDLRRGIGAGVHREELAVGDWAPGAYLVSVTRGARTDRLRLVKH